MIVVRNRGILRGQAADNIKKRFAVFAIPVQINKVALAAALADRDDLHDRDISGREHPHRAVGKEGLFGQEKRIGDKAYFRAGKFAVYRSLPGQRSPPLLVSEMPQETREGKC